MTYIKTESITNDYIPVEPDPDKAPCPYEGCPDPNPIEAKYILSDGWKKWQAKFDYKRS